MRESRRRRWQSSIADEGVDRERPDLIPWGRGGEIEDGKGKGREGNKRSHVWFLPVDVV